MTSSSNNEKALAFCLMEVALITSRSYPFLRRRPSQDSGAAATLARLGNVAARGYGPGPHRRFRSLKPCLFGLGACK